MLCDERMLMWKVTVTFSLNWIWPGTGGVGEADRCGVERGR